MICIPSCILFVTLRSKNLNVHMWLHCVVAMVSVVSSHIDTYNMPYNVVIITDGETVHGAFFSGVKLYTHLESLLHLSGALYPHLEVRAEHVGITRYV